MTLFKDKFKTNSHRLQNWNYSSEAVYFITIVTKDRKCVFGTIEDEKMILNENGKIVEIELLKSIKIRNNWFFHNWIIMPNHIHLLIEIQDQENQDKNIHETHAVETHRSASTSGISAMENNVSDNSVSTNVAETHCGAPLQCQSEVDSDSIFLSKTHTVETHRSASTSSISAMENNVSDNSVSTNVVEMHCGAPQQNQSDLKFVPETHIVETHRSASTSGISATDKSESKFSRKSNSISSFVAIFKSITTKQINGSESIWQANYHDHIVRDYKRFEKIYDYIKHNPRSWETDSLK